MTTRKHGADVSARAVLTCDACRTPIENQGLAMVKWCADVDGAVSSVMLVHKGRCDDRHDNHGYWDELIRLAHPAWALRKLVDLTRHYSFTADQSTKLIRIAWAASALSSDDEKVSSESTSMIMIESGFA